MTAAFEAFLAHPAPGFVCTSADASDRRHYVAPVRHRISSPATEEALRTLDLYPGHPIREQFRAFYGRHDGVLLFVPAIPRPKGDGTFLENDGGIQLFPLRDWQDQSESRLCEFYSVECAGQLPRSARRLVVVGQVPHSGNLIAWSPFGLRRGHLLHLTHDPPRLRHLLFHESIAPSFDRFLDAIAGSPVQLLSRLGCYTWYSDGQSNRQWFPDRYIPDITNPTPATDY